MWGSQWTPPPAGNRAQHRPRHRSSSHPSRQVPSLATYPGSVVNNRPNRIEVTPTTSATAGGQTRQKTAADRRHPAPPTATRHVRRTKHPIAIDLCAEPPPAPRLLLHRGARDRQPTNQGTRKVTPGPLGPSAHAGSLTGLSDHSLFYV